MGTPMQLSLMPCAKNMCAAATGNPPSEGAGPSYLHDTKLCRCCTVYSCPVGLGLLPDYYQEFSS